ncbi:hypothetical protein ACFOYU_27345 [Microvirga sp. GCM10011540]|uniref:hypothetical protein n=1 Tax=Microvirga sp. GCM10011540 TaxID=3317338 RepID=UPI003620054F
MMGAAMSKGASGVTVSALAGWAVITSYFMQPEELPPISSFVAFCGFLFAAVAIIWAIDELAEILRACYKHWAAQRSYSDQKGTSKSPSTPERLT